MTDKQFSFGDTSIAFEGKPANELRKMNLLFTLMGVPELTKIGIFLIKTSLKLNFPVKKIIKATLFRQFCGGETLEECQTVVNELYGYGIKSIPDYSAEGQQQEKNFADTTAMVRAAILMGGTEPAIDFSVFKITGLGKFELLEKLQKGAVLTEPEEMAFERIKYRVHHLCETAFQNKVRILIDAEESWIQQTIDTLALDNMRRFNKEKPWVYNTYQMYKTDSMEKLQKLVAQAREEGFVPAVKLVRGAYMEKERIRAQEQGYTSPIQPDKAATDWAFDEALAFCLDNQVALCVGTHNEESCSLTMALMKEKNMLPKNPLVCFAQLYGMSDHISYNLAKAGYHVAKYLPFGPVEAVMPYLFRRAEENKAVTGEMGRELGLIRQELKRRKTLRKNKTTEPAR
jgi:proline dehydrogenase